MHDLLSYLRERLTRIGARYWAAASGPRLELPPDRALDERCPAAVLPESIKVREERLHLRDSMDVFVRFPL